MISLDNSFQTRNELVLDPSTNRLSDSVGTENTNRKFVHSDDERREQNTYAYTFPASRHFWTTANRLNHYARHELFLAEAGRARFEHTVDRFLVRFAHETAFSLRFKSLRIRY
ncbi:hypothetical protein CP557_13620 [Natrinema ejinorense]|uniref:Uncharacterized protein n=1 Tax=Natrinema ejinorense TaxID=373386 RepID=A0A2A5QXE3_9EURY|nr:hypothetical protein CP557_13620 [Natrinema ejinorense]